MILAVSSIDNPKENLKFWKNRDIDELIKIKQEINHIRAYYSKK